MPTKKKAAKPAVKKKAAVKKMSDAEFVKLVNEINKKYETESKARYDNARKLYVKQDDATQEAIDRMVSMLLQIARRNGYVKLGGDDRRVFQLAEQAVYHNTFYTVIEICKDLAQLDVQVAKFVFDPHLCATCYAAIKPKKKAAKKAVKKRG